MRLVTLGVRVGGGTGGVPPGVARPLLDGYTAAAVRLRGDYSDEGLRIVATFGVNLAKLESFVRQTRLVGGRVAPCTLALPEWIIMFAADSDASFLVEGMAYGVDFDFEEGEATDYKVKNYVPDELSAQVSKQIAHEVEMGRVVRAVQGHGGVSAVGALLKPNGKVRLLSDFSRPRLGGVNSCIRVRDETFSRVRDAANMLRPGAFHCKVDITEAYRSFPMAPAWWKRHVFEWDGVLYSDLRMPFGNAGAPSAFHRFSMAFARAVKARGFPGVVPYLDDFWLTA